MLDRRTALKALATSSLAISTAVPHDLEGVFMPTDPAADSGDTTTYKTVGVNGVNIFYREAGPRDAPALLLLHGYPSSSRMYEPLLSRLKEHYRLIAPDYPGFGLSQTPQRSVWPYTFDRLAAAMLEFTDALDLKRYSLYLQDYGGPIGFQMALVRPERVQALVIQNAVIHEEGLTSIWNLRRSYWADRVAHELKIREGMYSVPAGIARHVGGRPHLERFNPDLWMDEIAFLNRPGMDAIQLDLIYDYQTNVKSYPKWQAYLRDQKPPVLIVWGVHDPIFSVEGAHAIHREQPATEVQLLDAGHFAINDRPDEISNHVQTFLKRQRV